MKFKNEAIEEKTVLEVQEFIYEFGHNQQIMEEAVAKLRQYRLGRAPCTEVEKIQAVAVKTADIELRRAISDKISHNIDRKEALGTRRYNEIFTVVY